MNEPLRDPTGPRPTAPDRPRNTNGPDRLPSAGAAAPSLSSVVEAFAARRWPSDAAFDSFLPDDVRAVSSRYWTPIAVAAQAACWFDEFDIHTVVDIGSGAGKFCVAACLAGRKPRRFIGLEHRSRLVVAARALADLFQVGGCARFLEGALGECALPGAQAYYLFNPFGENVYCAGEPLDEEVELSEERLARDVATVQDLLRTSPVGTFLVTYHGLGGTTPAGFDELRVAGTWPHILRLWQKREPGG